MTVHDDDLGPDVPCAWVSLREVIPGTVVRVVEREPSGFVTALRARAENMGAERTFMRWLGDPGFTAGRFALVLGTRTPSEDQVKEARECFIALAP